MQKLLSIIVFFQVSIYYAQTLTVNQRFSAPQYSSELKDHSDLMVLYNITFNNGKDQKITTQTVLQIGSKFSKFIDINTIGRDSLIEAHSKLESVGSKELNELGNYNIKYKKNVLKDFETNIIFYQEKIYKNTYQYSEPFPKEKWVLENGNMNILGYSCKAAS